MDEKKEQYFSTQQVAELVGCDKSYISMLCRNKSIECVTVAGRGRTGYKYMIPESVVEDLMLKREVEKGSVVMPQPITDSSKIKVVSEEEKDIQLELIGEVVKTIESLDKRLDTVQQAVTNILNFLNGITVVEEKENDWLPTAKEYMEQYRQGYLEGYRNGFRDGDRNSSSVRYSGGEKR